MLTWMKVGIALTVAGVLGGQRATLARVDSTTVRAEPRSPATFDSIEDRRVISRSKGSPSAPIVVYELSDFQCPYCRQFALETFPLLEQRYVATGKIRWVYLTRPKPAKHKNAVAAAEFAQCAARQGKFWAMHDALFAAQDTWAESVRPDTMLTRIAIGIGTDPARLNACLANGFGRAEMVADSSYGPKWGVAATPAFSIAGVIVTGALPVNDFILVIDSVLRAR